MKQWFPIQDGTCLAGLTTPTACPIKHEEKREWESKHSKILMINLIEYFKLESKFMFSVGEISWKNLLEKSQAKDCFHYLCLL